MCRSAWAPPPSGCQTASPAGAVTPSPPAPWHGSCSSVFKNVVSVESYGAWPFETGFSPRRVALVHLGRAWVSRWSFFVVERDSAPLRAFRSFQVLLSQIQLLEVMAHRFRADLSVHLSGRVPSRALVDPAAWPPGSPRPPGLCLQGWAAPRWAGGGGWGSHSVCRRGTVASPGEPSSSL